MISHIDRIDRVRRSAPSVPSDPAPSARPDPAAALAAAVAELAAADKEMARHLVGQEPRRGVWGGPVGVRPQLADATGRRALLVARVRELAQAAGLPVPAIAVDVPMPPAAAIVAAMLRA